MSSERGPRVTGGGSLSCMAPGVRDPLLRPRLPACTPASASAHPAQSLTTAPGLLLGSRCETDRHQVAPLCSRCLSPLSQLALASSQPDRRRNPAARHTFLFSLQLERLELDKQKHTPPYLMATENGAVELGIQSPSTGAKLGQEMEGGAWEGVFESRVGPVPQGEFCA